MEIAKSAGNNEEKIQRFAALFFLVRNGKKLYGEQATQAAGRKELLQMIKKNLFTYVENSGKEKWLRS